MTDEERKRLTAALRRKLDESRALNGIPISIRVEEEPVALCAACGREIDRCVCGDRT